MLFTNFISNNTIKQSNASYGKNLVVTKAANKGAVCIQVPLNYFNLNLPVNGKLPSNYAFICCHLPSDIDNSSKWKERDNISYDLIKDLNINLSSSNVILFGDLNYRLGLDHLECLKLITTACQKGDITLSQSSWTQLFYSDELHISMNNGNAFQNFVEVGDIRFPPTYKRLVYIIFLIYLFILF